MGDMSNDIDGLVETFGALTRDVDGYGESVLSVSGGGPFLRQIQRMASELGITVEVVEEVEVTPDNDVDAILPEAANRFFTSTDSDPREDLPCVAYAMYSLINGPRIGHPDGIAVIGRGRIGSYMAKLLSSLYGRVEWLGSGERISGNPELIVNCSDGRVSGDVAANVVDIHDMGRLNTAILLYRTALRGHGALRIL